MQGQGNRSRNSYNDSHTLESRPSPSNEVYIMNLPEDIEEENLRQIFEDHGKVTRVNLKKRENGFTFGFVHYEDQEMASKAIEMLNHAKIGDKIVKASFAKGKSSNNSSSFNQRDTNQKQTNYRDQNNRRPPRGDMDSSSDRSQRSESGERGFDGRGRGRGRGTGRGRGGFGNTDRQSDARKKFGNHQESRQRSRDYDRNRDERGGPWNNDRSTSSGRNQSKYSNHNRQQGSGNRGDYNNTQRGGGNRPNTCYKCHQPGHKAFQCTKNGNDKSKNDHGNRGAPPKMSEEQFSDY